MKLEWFIARRISGKSYNKGVSSTVVKIAVAAVALSVAVMIVSMSVIIGFKNEIMDKVVGFGSCVNIVNRETGGNYETMPISSEQDFFPSIENEQGINHIQRYVMKPAILKSGADILGVIIKGVGSEYNFKFFEDNMVEGCAPKIVAGQKTDSMLISKRMADLLNLKLGDKVVAYFVQDPPRMRKYTVSGIYQTGLEDYDKLFCFTDMTDIQKINGWNENQISGFEVMIDDFSKLEDMSSLVREYAGYQISEDGAMLRVTNVKDNNRQLFDWITLTEMNVYVILAIMFFVAFVNMSTAMLIIIFERAAMIGIMKAVGSNNWLIRKIFIIQSVHITSRGVVIGNIVAAVLILLEQYFHLVGLDPASYYVDHVPAEFQLWYFIAIDLGTLLVMSIMLVLPSMAISKMEPAKVVNFR
ncbi:MAG: FtsX-like permease family protein [Bacteroidales bacterium]|nr:FtsX-like permease family protein [Bacteroidales bacterium]